MHLPETRSRLVHCVLVVLALCAVSPTRAADKALAPTEATQKESGWRSGLLERGISLEASYKVDLLRNVRGGMTPGGGAMEHLDVQWQADLEKLWGWEGVSSYVNFIDDRGRRVNTEHVGSLSGTSNIEVPRATHRFYHAWVQKAWNEGRSALLVGLYPVDSEFAVMESAALFVQPPYGAWADFGLSRSPSIFNNSSFGARFKWLSESRDFYVQATTVAGRPGNPSHPVGTHIRFGQGDGAQVVTEAGYQPQREDDAPEAFDKLLAGYWRYTAPVADLLDTDAAGNPQNRRSDGWYVAAERTLARGEGDGNLSAFARYSFNNGNTIPIRSALNLGLRLRGMLLPGRDDDVVGIAFTRAATAAKFRAAQALAGVDATTSEDSLELTYRVKPASWLAVQPLIQRIRHPGADRSLSPATVLGVRIEVSL